MNVSTGSQTLRAEGVPCVGVSRRWTLLAKVAPASLWFFFCSIYPLQGPLWLHHRFISVGYTDLHCHHQITHGETPPHLRCPVGDQPVGGRGVFFKHLNHEPPIPYFGFCWCIAGHFQLHNAWQPLALSQRGRISPQWCEAWWSFGAGLLPMCPSLHGSLTFVANFLSENKTWRKHCRCRRKIYALPKRQGFTLGGFGWGGGQNVKGLHLGGLVGGGGNPLHQICTCVSFWAVHKSTKAHSWTSRSIPDNIKNGMVSQTAWLMIVWPTF